jgi:hypothetical protein
MLAILVALLLLVLSVGGVYLLLKSMGQDGVEAAAPGSCKSGRCGVQPRETREEASSVAQGQSVRVDEIKRIDSLSNNQVH